MNKPNKQKTDWEKEFEEREWYPDLVDMQADKEVKDFISKLLQQQREDFKQTMANSNEWWNNKLRQQREEIIKEIEGIVGEDDKTPDDALGVGVRIIRNQLRKEIRERLKQI